MSRRPPQPLRFILLAVAVAVAIPAPRGWAGSGDPLTSTQRELLSRLASADYRTRQAATERLLQDAGVTIGQLRRLYRAATVQEQQHRLMDVAYHHAMRDLPVDAPVGAGSGFIGIEMVPGISDADSPEDAALDAVVVVRTFRGFPGHAHLRPADVILSVNDHRVDPETFTRQVGTVRPGRPVTLTVRREGRTRRIRFPIGDRSALSRLYGTDGQVLESARVQLQRVQAVVTGQAPLDSLAGAAPKDVGPGASNPAADRPQVSVPVRD